MKEKTLQETLSELYEKVLYLEELTQLMVVDMQKLREKIYFLESTTIRYYPAISHTSCYLNTGDAITPGNTISGTTSITLSNSNITNPYGDKG